VTPCRCLPSKRVGGGQPGNGYLGRDPIVLLTVDMKDLLEHFQQHEVQYVLVGGFAVSIISLEDLVEAKRNSDRPRDLADADELEDINR
jgi:hypothetical protein